jgi:alpha-1,6-mannosyltransferase
LLAAIIQIDRLSGTPLAVIGVAVAAFATAGFGLALYSAWRQQIGAGTVLACGLISIGSILTLPVLFSRDVYSYAYEGRLVAVYGLNPYTSTPIDAAQDPLWEVVGPLWVSTPSVYGPGFVALAGGIGRSVEGIGAQVQAYRWIAAGAAAGTLVLVGRSARSLRPRRQAFALAAFGLNPVVLFHSTGSAHNDLLVALAVASALVLVIHDRTVAAAGILALGALVKASAALPLLLLVVWVIARAEPARRVRVAMSHAGIALAIGILFAAPFLQAEDPTLGMLELATHEGWLAPSYWLRRWVDRASFFSMGTLVRWAVAALILMVIVGLLRAIWRRGLADGSIGAVRELGAGWGWSMLVLALLGPVLLPWYVIWALPVVWLLPPRGRELLLGASAVLVLAQWSAEADRFPGMFDVNVWANTWVFTPILVVLLVRALFDLRGRLLGDSALDDQEREPAAAGQR